MQSEINKFGNTVTRTFIQNGDRYMFDFDICSAKKGWLQFDTEQDAHYFGVWVNKQKMEIVTYAEGDVIQTSCKNKDSFNAEIKSMCEYYAPTSSLISVHTNIRKDYYQDRKDFFITD